MLCIQVLVFTKLNFRTLNECSCKCRAVLFRERFILNFRLGYRYKLFILKCLFQCAVEYDFLSFAFNSFLAQVHFQYLARCLALAETLQSDLVCETGNCLFVTFNYISSRYFHRYLDLVLVQCFYLYVHLFTPP